MSKTPEQRFIEALRETTGSAPSAEFSEFVEKTAGYEEEAEPKGHLTPEQFLEKGAAEFASKLAEDGGFEATLIAEWLGSSIDKSAEVVPAKKSADVLNRDALKRIGSEIVGFRSGRRLTKNKLSMLNPMNWIRLKKSRALGAHIGGLAHDAQLVAGGVARELREGREVRRD